MQIPAGKAPGSQTMAANFKLLRHMDTETRLKLDIKAACELERGKWERRPVELMAKLAKFYLYHEKYGEFASFYRQNPRLADYADDKAVAGEAGAILASEGKWRQVGCLFDELLLRKGMLLLSLFDMKKYGAVLQLLEDGRYGITPRDVTEGALEAYQFAIAEKDEKTVREIRNLGLFTTQEQLVFDWQMQEVMLRVANCYRTSFVRKEQPPNRQ